MPCCPIWGPCTSIEEHTIKPAVIRGGLKLAWEAGLQQQTNALLTNLAVLLADVGILCGARAYFEQALELARQMGQRSHTSHLLTNLGDISQRAGGARPRRPIFPRGLNLARQMAERERVGHLLANLGAWQWKKRISPWHNCYLNESLTLSREIGHRQNTIFALTNLADYAPPPETLPRRPPCSKKGWRSHGTWDSPVMSVRFCWSMEVILLNRSSGRMRSTLIGKLWNWHTKWGRELG